MGLSRRSLKGIHALNAIQRKNLKYLVPQLTDHEKALKIDARMTVEKVQKEARVCRIKNLLVSK